MTALTTPALTALTGKPTSRPGTKTPAWYNTPAWRVLTVEMSHVIDDAPLRVPGADYDVGADERRFLRALWRVRKVGPQGKSTRWPPDTYWADRFGVETRTIQRWRTTLILAGAIDFRRPWNISNSNGGWKGPRKGHGFYTLHPPSRWRYRHDWQYAGHRVGWVDADGAGVDWPPTPGAPGATAPALDGLETI